VHVRVHAAGVDAHQRHGVLDWLRDAAQMIRYGALLDIVGIAALTLWFGLR
jgi:hypothetical protein